MPRTAAEQATGVARLGDRLLPTANGGELPMKFSVVTISFNQRQYLEEALRSVLTQDYPAIEYIVVDPVSTDGSRELIESFASQLARVIFEPDRGAADGLNNGFQHASGDIFGFLNSDDVLLPGVMSNVAHALGKTPDGE